MMLASTLLRVALAGSCSLVAADLLNTAWLLNDGEPQGTFQNVSGGRSARLSIQTLSLGSQKTNSARASSHVHCKTSRQQFSSCR